MKREVIKELKARGYEADIVSREKNGVTKEGISINKAGSRIAPIIYVDWEKVGSVDEAVEIVINRFEKYKNPQFEQMIEEMISTEYIKENVFIALQKESEEELVKEPCYPGIEAYLRVLVNNTGEKATFKITKQMMERLKIDEIDLWNQAYENLKKHVTVKKMSDLLGDIREHLGLPEEIPDEMIMAADKEMYIFSLGNPLEGRYGASAILHEEKLNEICEKHNVNKLLICPSSIHEAIVVPYDGKNSVEDMSWITREVNKEVVAPEEQLSDEAFLYVMK